jgi:hypothetical protein
MPSDVPCVMVFCGCPTRATGRLANNTVQGVGAYGSGGTPALRCQATACDIESSSGSGISRSLKRIVSVVDAFFGR